MAQLNKYGLLPIGFVRGNSVWPTADFQRWLSDILTRTGGVDSATLSATEYDTYVGAPIGQAASVIDGGPVQNVAAAIDGAPI